MEAKANTKGKDGKRKQRNDGKWRGGRGQQGRTQRTNNLWLYSSAYAFGNITKTRQVYCMYWKRKMARKRGIKGCYSLALLLWNSMTLLPDARILSAYNRAFYLSRSIQRYEEKAKRRKTWKNQCVAPDRWTPSISADRLLLPIGS